MTTWPRFMAHLQPEVSGSIQRQCEQAGQQGTPCMKRVPSQYMVERVHPAHASGSKRIGGLG